LDLGGQEMSEKVMEYLTMTRIMNNELEKWQEDKINNWRTLTAMEQLIANSAFRSGFMTGFQARFFGHESN
jgi:hypothetical protein